MKTPSYEEALNSAKRVGAVNATGFAALAQLIWALSRVHAINPENTYKGAVRVGADYDEVRRLAKNPIRLGELQFEV